MKISLNWLKNFIELNNSPEEISNLLTEVGLEVESIEKLGNEKSKLNDLNQLDTNLNISWKFLHLLNSQLS